jgi:Holliday junction resolvasome RuvABC endonuclease subunit
MSYTLVSIGVDPGLAVLGWARIARNSLEKRLDYGIIKTAKSDKKALRLTRQSSDDNRRIAEITTQLYPLLHHEGSRVIVNYEWYRPLAFTRPGQKENCCPACGKSQSGDISSGWKTGIVCGAVIGAAVCAGAEVVARIPNDIKQAAGGRSIGKDVVIQYVERIYGELKIAKSHKQHVADAIMLARLGLTY